jgi:hypothetical protein
MRVYRFVSSGVLWEAIAYGRPVIVPAGSYLEGEARLWGASHCAIDTSSAASTASALSAILAAERWDDAISRQAGDRFRAANGVRRFVDLLSSLSGRQP